MNEPSTVPGLAEYYARSGLAAGSWLVGPEHPALEALGIRLLSNTASARILELGVQSGGFAVPVILSCAHREGFAYTGVDNLAYTNAVPLHHIADYLALHRVTHGLRFVESESGTVVLDAASSPLLKDAKPMNVLIHTFAPYNPVTRNLSNRTMLLFPRARPVERRHRTSTPTIAAGDT
jgi:hypothetical protein